MKYVQRAIILLCWLAGWIITSHGQEPGENNDYQYALIEAVKQKNLGNIPEAVKLYRLVIQAKPDCDAAYYELGTIYFITGQMDLAEEYLARAYEMIPDNQWYTLGYLNVLVAREDYRAAAKILKRRTRTDPGEAEWEYQLASVRHGQGKNKKAINILEKIEKERGFSEKVTLLKASIYESQEDYGLARVEVEKVMNLFPEAVQFRVLAAELSMKGGDEKSAAQYYHEILEMDSTNIFALTNLTDYYRKKGDYKSSFSYLARSFRNDLIDVKRKMAILSYYLSEDAFVTGYPEELASLLKVLLEIYPDEPDIKLMAAEFFMKTTAYEEAYFQLKNYLEKEGGSYPIYLQAIILANAAALNEEIIEMTGKALKMYPDSADIRFFRGIGMYEEKQYEQLVENFAQVSKENYSQRDYSIQANMLIAEALYRLGEYNSSDSIFEQMIAEDPENYMILNNYSYYLAERGEKLGNARLWSEKVIRNHPDNFTYLDTYAWILYKMEQYEDAETYIMEALRKGGSNDPEVNEHAGDIQYALKSYEMAVSYYRKAIILGGEKSKLEEKIYRIRNHGAE
ncbi:MAG TPA: tetratricopeptide repeat protein [Bacteroides sp.]|nr:tetratricopeptide repeat protein [Bacteroides sp.]